MCTFDTDVAKEGAVAVVVFLILKDDMRALMLRIAKIKLPGGSELSTSQKEMSAEAQATTGDAANTAQARQNEARLWEYRYLNLFLVRGTQMALDWFAGQTAGTTAQMFDSWWLPFIPSAKEREAIITALQAHRLIEIDGDAVEVTEKGRDYLRFRGPLAPLPGQAAKT